MSEMLTYGTDLTSMTQGRGSFNMEMDHYDVVPSLQQEKIIAAAKAATRRGSGRRRVTQRSSRLSACSVAKY